MKPEGAKSLLDYFGALGRSGRQRLAAGTGIFGLLYRLVSSIWIGFGNYRFLTREFSLQIYRIGARGWPIVALSGLLLGLAIIVYISAELRKIQLEQLIGSLLVIIVVRELGPILTALLVLLRSGAAMTVEIGTMVIDREMESLELMGVEPEIFVGAPRFWGLLVSLLILYVIFLVSAILGGYLFGQLLTEIYWQKLWLSFLGALTWQDLFMSLGKILLFGMALGTVAIYYGFLTQEKGESLVEQTSQGAVTSLFVLGLLNALFSVLTFTRMAP